MKYTCLFIFLILVSVSNAKSVNCEFEEVYQDGSIQSGQILYSDGLLRYQYDDNQLFTIIFNNDYFAIRNDNRKIVNKLENDDILNELKSIINNYPKIKKIYKKNDIKIELYESIENNFLKRISINSLKVNLSIYFINCSFDKIPKKYFQPFLLLNIKK